MRGREFLMKDAYSFDLDEEGLKASYEAMFVAYLRTFARLGLTAVPVRAPTGPIGGDLSHEFHILAETGESAIFYDAALDDVSREELLTADAATIAKLTGLYAMEEEEHAKVADCPVPAGSAALAARHRGRATSSPSAPNIAPAWASRSRPRTAARSIRRWAAMASACRG